MPDSVVPESVTTDPAVSSASEDTISPGFTRQLMQQLQNTISGFNLLTDGAIQLRRRLGILERESLVANLHRSPEGGSGLDGAVFS